MNIKMPKNVETILSTLDENGYEAFIVGGCVRDVINGKIPKDWDITTSARPEEIKRIFKRTVDTGIAHGTVTIIMDEGSYEVTTYRVDGDYKDNRHPENVNFTSSLEEDLMRRDFTINAMAYNEKRKIVDIFNGQEDIAVGIIRCVGVPDDRFREDGLRMLRAIRFSAQLNFEIEKETLEAIKRNAHLITNISAERVRDEISKILVSKNPRKFMMLHTTGLLEYIMPEFIPNIGCPQRTPWHMHNVADHIICTVESIENRLDLRWTMLLHDIAKAKCRVTDNTDHDHFVGHAEEGAVMAQEILERFKFDNKNIKRITRLVKYHDVSLSLEEVEVRKLIAKIGEDIFEDLLTVVDADDVSKARLVWLESQERTKALRQMYKVFKEKNYCLKKEDLDITGNDLMNIGYTQGKDIGNTIDELFEVVLESPELNNNIELIKLAENRFNRIKDKSQ